MPLTIEAQLSIILSSILAGVITGGLFDIYRLIRGVNVPKIIVVIEDILFWALAAVSIFAFLLYTDYAFLGAYVYVFISLSLLLYLKFVSPFFMKIERKLFEILYKFIRVLLKYIAYPFRVIYYTISGKNDSNKKIS